MKVFVSSTVYDLIDIRAEIADLLRSCGISPVLSDDKLSDFAITPNNNSIETCLVNVDACDEMIVILDKRYGPRLGSVGFDDVSATHLEYRRFLKTGRLIHFFVRDRFEADYAIWKNNIKSARKKKGKKKKKKKKAINLAWVEEKDFGLFEFFEEHKNLKYETNTSNWKHQFTSSSDLKAYLRKHYQDLLLPERLTEAIYNNAFPSFSVTATVESRNNERVARITATNVGTQTALNTRMTVADQVQVDEPIYVVPTQSIDRLFPINDVNFLDGEQISKPLDLEYESVIGVKVIEKHQIDVRRIIGANAVAVTVRQTARRFFRGAKPVVPIVEDQDPT